MECAGAWNRISPSRIGLKGGGGEPRLTPHHPSKPCFRALAGKPSQEACLTSAEGGAGRDHHETVTSESGWLHPVHRLGSTVHHRRSTSSGAASPTGSPEPRGLTAASRTRPP